VALAAILRITIQGNGGGGGGATRYSWISKGLASGVNKHGAWVIAVLLWTWRRVC
jgi:hypothetical protein